MSSTSHLPFFRSYSSDPVPSAESTSFTLRPSTSSPTDIWRKPGPPPVKTFNAPTIYKSITLSTFQRARVTISSTWSNLYDQGGLVFILQDGKNNDTDQKWIKSGIEFFDGEAYVSTVAADRWADWSLVQAGIKDGKEVTLEMERNEKEGTLWIYVIDGERRIPIREVTWVLSEAGEMECWVGVYAATPTIEGSSIKNGTEHELKVQFSGWQLQIKE